MRGLFPEKVIDPVGLILGKCLAHNPIEFARGGEIGAERFFDNDPRPAPIARLVQTSLLKILHDGLELVRRDREIKKPITAGPALPINFLEALRQALVAGRIVELTLMIENGLGEAVPDFVAHRLARKFPGGFFLLLAEFLVRFRATRKTDHRQRWRQFAIGRDVVERGNQFPHRQVAGRPENHDRARLRHGPRREPLAERIGLRSFRSLAHRAEVMRRFRQIRAD